MHRPRVVRGLQCLVWPTAMLCCCVEGLGVLTLWLGAQYAHSECYDWGMGIVYCGMDVVQILACHPTEGKQWCGAHSVAGLG